MNAALCILTHFVCICMYVCMLCVRSERRLRKEKFVVKLKDAIYEYKNVLIVGVSRQTINNKMNLFLAERFSTTAVCIMIHHLISILFYSLLCIVVVSLLLLAAAAYYVPRLIM